MPAYTTTLSRFSFAGLAIASLLALTGCGGSPGVMGDEEGDGRGDGGGGPPGAGSRDGGASGPSGEGDGGALAEVCGNGLDDDGNGAVDDGCRCVEGETQACFGGSAVHAGRGACLFGEQVCTVAGEFSSWGECTGWIAPSAETCGDGIDQDCDGSDGSCSEYCGNAVCEGGESCVTCPADCGECSGEPAPCGASPSGAVETRTMYESPSVPYGEACESETQSRTCFDGEWTAWTGTYTFTECEVDPAAECVDDGVTPAISGGQNCRVPHYPETMIQADTVDWSGCCGYLVRVCVVEGFSPLNEMYCDADADLWCNPDAYGVCLF